MYPPLHVRQARESAVELPVRSSTARKAGDRTVLKQSRACMALIALCLAGCGPARDADSDEGDASAAPASSEPRPGSYFTTPLFIDQEGVSAQAERGLFFVPENRTKPDSRVIPIHFVRFRAKHAEPGRPPVFWLPGGPGMMVDFEKPNRAYSFGVLRDIDRLRRTRDVIYVGQRGNPREPQLSPALWSQTSPAPLSEPSTVERVRERRRTALDAAIDQWSQQGVDLSGYDILNIVDDLHDLRAALGYDKIVLRGCSFGSHWSFFYMKRWPQTVDRAFLSGVEPPNYAYDSPAHLWKGIGRLAQAAQADPGLAPHLVPDLPTMLQAVIERLERQPVSVKISNPTDGREVEVALGAEDLRQNLRNVTGLMGGDTERGNLANWPRFIIELYRGDYRYLAAMVLHGRLQGSRAQLIGLLIDNSIGITAQRDAQLLAEPERRWLGDVNAAYHDTRDLTPTPGVGDALLANLKTDIPLLLIAGQWDWSTPPENVQEVRPLLSQAHVVTVEEGTHCTEYTEMPALLPAESERLYSFVDADFARESPQQVFGRIPGRVALPALRFNPPEGPSLYEQWLARE